MKSFAPQSIVLLQGIQWAYLNDDGKKKQKKQEFHVIYLYYTYIHICRTATWASLELPMRKKKQICILSHLHTAGLLLL